MLIFQLQIFMEFYEFFEKLVSYVPADFQRLKTACENILPWLFGLLTVTTSFAGHFMHKVWNIFFFFRRRNVFRGIAANVIFQ